MGDVYPELRERQSSIAKICLEEETRFRETLERGVRMLDDEAMARRAGEDRPGRRWRSSSTTPTASRSI